MLRWLAVAAWMGLIFFFSSQTGEESGKNNFFIIQMLLDAGIDIQKMLPWVDVNFFIRKAAHITEYFVLAILFSWALDNGRRSRGKILALSGLFSLIYAASDEFHQSFVPERGPGVVDVMVDSIGISLALLLRGVRARRH